MMISESKTYRNLSELREICKDLLSCYNIHDDEALEWLIIRSTGKLRQEYLDYNIKHDKISLKETAKVYESVIRYARGESIQDIFGVVEFYNNIYKVDQGVFIPRMSTETLVKAVIEEFENGIPTMLELGTGTGAVSIAINKEINVGSSKGIDICELSLVNARYNALYYDTEVIFAEGDILDVNTWGDSKVDVIVSNPPYWTSFDVYNNDVPSELIHAYNGGDSGLKYIEYIVKNAKNVLNDGGFLFLEVDSNHANRVKGIMVSHGFPRDDIMTRWDHRGLPRVVYGRIQK